MFVGGVDVGELGIWDSRLTVSNLTTDAWGKEGCYDRGAGGRSSRKTGAHRYAGRSSFLRCVCIWVTAVASGRNECFPLVTRSFEQMLPLSTTIGGETSRKKWLRVPLSLSKHHSKVGHEVGYFGQPILWAPWYTKYLRQSTSGVLWRTGCCKYPEQNNIPQEAYHTCWIPRMYGTRGREGSACTMDFLNRR